MDWLAALTGLGERGEAAVLATLVSARGHAPREPGAKIVITANESWGTIGGGNLEATVIHRAHALLAEGTIRTELASFSLNEHARADHGVQCCGGEVTVLLEPFPVRPTIAIFGFGHVGYEIAHVFSRHAVNLVLVDSRPEVLAPERVQALSSGVATLKVRDAPAPEQVVADLPSDAAVLILTHDHAEDLILCDAALRSERTGYTGLIGSSAKWQRFRKRLRELGHDDAMIDRITCPIGDPRIRSKQPAAIAVAVAAELLTRGETTAKAEQSARSD
ncbi:xanthine dehydrogenase accessory protein XdhC [Saccharopolyspora shandongensis]|uniref:xanthine dehydrogenase accessory protein XdhC n=1 Tax=Saccharopolyspora shandongensis TaxID=418495 RepID=UPI0033ECA5D6